MAHTRLPGLLAACSLAAASCFMIVTPAHAVLSDGFFELDGNTVPDATVLGADWNNFHPNASGGNTTRSTGIVADLVPAVFRNGSKDTQDVSEWRFDLGSSPPKDNMLNAYAAAYTATAGNGTTTSVGDLLIYFGADRASFSGTASLGFWFFKNPIERNNATGTFINPVTGGLATHAEGDVLLAFEYTNGGAVTGIRAFTWTNGKLDAGVSLGVPTPTNVAGVSCDPLDKACGTTNSGSLTLPWNGTIQPGQFFEGGVNISKLLPGAGSCFSAFMATSRTSDTAQASIKNFILSNFPVCSMQVTKECTAVFRGATNDVLATVRGRIYNDGGGLLTNITVVDNPAFSPNTLQFQQCTNGQPNGTSQSPASLAAGADICFVAEHVANTLQTTDTVTVTATAGTDTLTKPATANCTADPPGPSTLSLTKICDVDLEAAGTKLALKVNYSGSVTNNGSVTLSNVKVCEVQEIALGDEMKDPCDLTYSTTHTIGTMAPAAVVQYSGSYYPTKALTAAGAPTLTSPHLAVFNDKVGSHGVLPAILGGTTIKAMPVPATCELCPPH